MRDAVGGTFMIYVFVIFLAVYITFVAVAFNYARAFKVKNKVIDIIEQNEGIRDFNDTSSDSVLGQIDEYLARVSYLIDCKNVSDEDNCYGRGYLIEEVRATSSVDGMTATYYKVTTFIRLEIPFLDLGFTIPVKGETRKIERIS